jgi:hypothetical protein
MNRNHVFDSSGPDLRLRGTAQQLFEKYLQLGRDATGGGDRVMAEAYFQHAEHYFRILGAMNQAQIAQGGQHQPQQGQNQQHRRYQQDDQQGGEEQGGEEQEGEAQGEAHGEAQTVPPVRGEGSIEEAERLAEAIEAELSAEAEAEAARGAR